ncbi:hypothetical protein BDZ91DRAFT_137155 [Kalaharituber pfeilii]|nr:hypothetical protein BDZ91DRAFT_137155 [Kalaharituber pfeilii]
MYSSFFIYLFFFKFFFNFFFFFFSRAMRPLAPPPHPRSIHQDSIPRLIPDLAPPLSKQDPGTYKVESAVRGSLKSCKSDNSCVKRYSMIFTSDLLMRTLAVSL